MTSCLLSKGARLDANISDLATAFPFLGHQKDLAAIGEAVLTFKRGNKLAEEVREGGFWAGQGCQALSYRSLTDPKTLMRMFASR